VGWDWVQSRLWSNRWNENRHGKPKYSEKTCPSATMSTTNPTWLYLGSNTGCHGGKPVTNHLSYGAVLQLCNINISNWKPFNFLITKSLKGISLQKGVMECARSFPEISRKLELKMSAANLCNYLLLSGIQKVQIKHMRTGKSC
jgi:hypothetical protein